MKYEARKLKGRIVEKYGTQGAFAEVLGVAENTVSRKINGVVSFSREDILQWCDLLEINRDHIGDYFFTEEV